MTIHDRIPADFPVRPLAPNDDAADKVTCGSCGLSWDDAIPTSYTPAPSARCPFEAFHLIKVEREDLRHNLIVMVHWPNDDPERARVVKTGKRLELWFESQQGEVLNIFPKINDQLLAILEII